MKQTPCYRAAKLKSSEKEMREVFFAYSDVLVKEEKSGLNRKLKAPFRIERDTLSGRHYPAELTALWGALHTE